MAKTKKQYDYDKKFRKEVGIALIAKLTALFIVWLLFFSHPLTDHLNDAKVVQHYFTAQITTQEDNHGHNT